MSDAKKPNPLVDALAELPGKIFRREALNTVLLLAIGAGGLVYAQAHEKAVVDAGIVPVSADLAQHKLDAAAKFSEVQADVAAVKRQLDASEERSAKRFEALYFAVLERRPQPGADELAKPQTAPDGGVR